MAVALLHGDTVAAKTARHGDIDRRVDRDAGCCILCCVELDGIRQRIAARNPLGEDIDLGCVHRDVFAVARIDAGRIADRVLHLEVEFMACGVDAYIVVCGIDGGEDVGLFITEFVFADIDELVAGIRLCTCHRIGIAARLPYCVWIRRGGRCCAADLCGRREVDRRKRTRHMVGRNRGDLVELIQAGIGGKILCLPCVRRCISVCTILIAVEILSELQPEPLRILLGIQCPEPTVMVDVSDLRPVGGCIGEEV